jgi:hypothetical protein
MVLALNTTDTTDTTDSAQSCEIVMNGEDPCGEERAGLGDEDPAIAS